MLVIVGTGAMGSLFAAELAPYVSAPLWMLGSWDEAIAQINTQGLQLDAPSGEVFAKVRATSHPRDCAGAKFALVLVKAWQTPQVAKRIAEFLAPDGLALTLQNGLGNYEALAAELDPERVALGITTLGATLLGPGHVRVGGRGPIHIAAHPRLPPLLEIFRAANLEVQVVDAVTALTWGKLVVNAAINPLTALLRVPNGELLNRPAALRVAELAAQESAAVARAQHIALPFDNPIARVHNVMRLTALNYSSMYQDVARGAPTEIDAINGAVVRAAQLCGLTAPVNETLWRLVVSLRP